MTTLLSRLEAADALHEQARFGSALAAYEDLVERAQERSDRSVEVAARSMAARCLLCRGDLEGARSHLAAAEAVSDPSDISAVARRWAAQARFALHEPDPHATQAAVDAYLRWADRHDHAPAIVDACSLAAERSDGEDRAAWLERAAHEAVSSELHGDIGRLFTELGACLDSLGRLDHALAAYESALRQHLQTGTLRQQVGARWAAGEAALRLEDYPLASSHLEAAVRSAERSDDALDLLALALSDLARVYEAAGDVVEARRAVLRSVRVAREQDLPGLWPARWRSLIAFAHQLELEV